MKLNVYDDISSHYEVIHDWILCRIVNIHYKRGEDTIGIIKQNDCAMAKGENSPKAIFKMLLSQGKFVINLFSTEEVQNSFSIFRLSMISLKREKHIENYQSFFFNITWHAGGWDDYQKISYLHRVLMILYVTLPFASCLNSS